MSVVLRMGHHPENHIRFHVSPLAELVCALHLLDNPSHHAHREFGVQISAALTTDLLVTFKRFAHLWRGFRARFFLPTKSSMGNSFDSGLNELTETATETFVELAIHAIRGGGSHADIDGVSHDKALQNRVLAHARARGGEAHRLVQDLFSEPDAVKNELCEVLGRCWRLFFSQIWTEVAPVLVHECRIRTGMLHKEGALRTLLSAIPSAYLSTTGDAITIDKLQYGLIDVNAAHLILVPTLLGWPHLLVKDDSEYPVIQYPAVSRQQRTPPSLAIQRRRMRALSDPVCLQLCRDIAREPRSTLQLSERWNLDRSLISRQLRLLREAELVETTRQGHFVLYRLRIKQIAYLGNDVLNALLR